MRELLFSSDLGVSPYVPCRKEWIATAIGAVGGLASSLIGGGASSSAARKAQKMLDQEKAKEDAWYNRRYYEDYVDTAAGQNLVRRAKDYAKESWRKAAGAKAVAGGTDASVQMAKDAGNKMVGDTIANIAATDQARKSNVDNLHMQNQMKFSERDAALEQQRAQNISNAASAASNAMMSIGSAVDQAGSKTNLSGGSNNSMVVEKPANTPSVDYSAIRENNSYYANMSDKDIAEHLAKMNATSGF